MFPLKELQEAGLSASGPLDPPETQVIAGSLQVAHVHGQILQPQTRTLSHSGQLGGPVGGAGAVREGREGKRVNTACKTALREVQLYADSLVVCEAKRGEVGVFLCKVCQSVNNSGQLCETEQRVLALSYCIIHCYYSCATLPLICLFLVWILRAESQSTAKKIISTLLTCY